MSWIQNAIRWFLPSEEGFFDYVIAAAEAALQSALTFSELSGATGEAARIALVERIKGSEHEADRALHDMADALGRTFVTPMDREDLYSLTGALESITDFVSATANQITVHHMGTLPTGTVDLSRVLLKSTQLLREAADLLGKPNSHGRIVTICREVHRHEHEADVIFRTRMGDLFANEKDAVMLIKYKEFLEGLEDATDRCLMAARVLEGIVLKHG